MRIPIATLQAELQRILEKKGITAKRATLCARLFSETDRDGIYSHGLNRFPRFMQYLQKGYVIPDAEPLLEHKHGSFERWNGQQGPGNLNAFAAMNQAIALAKKAGIGGVALRNTNHWMRGGTYGWQAADAGCVAFCFTNTIPNMPPWGGKTPAIGNNPFVVAVPHSSGQHVVLDMAMSQYSYGKLRKYAEAGQELLVPGGYDAAGDLTQHPAAIEATERALPIGFWKGSGLSILLDLALGILAGGRTTADIAGLEEEYGVSQVFICLDVSQFQDSAFTDDIIRRTVDFIKSSTPVSPGSAILYPGENTWRTRQENINLGVPVDPVTWEKVLQM
ncbi:2,3-diketo-L-gulonate reductase [Adhaeribacter aerolatus]|uniref:2,3-diketo-L-gulonate reductase n=1 Tax=Adhaeribacter aerolatus TaxID=670289 RepID=A0A512B2Z3_9BACT|nr:3-dehydro-L-gulonate 2-dehydrogenase [Adhaeribacter aerolatus]GEO06329.1 2,3-diketo-L-gulonate reductase [Adhaeribacter aerolatus]